MTYKYSPKFNKRRTSAQRDNSPRFNLFDFTNLYIHTETEKNNILINKL